jgi:uncharacterized protein
VASGLPKKTIRWISFRCGATLVILFVALNALFGCGRKSVSPAKINSVAQDLAAAAQSAAGGRAGISIRPEMGRFGNSKPSLVADDIFIELCDALPHSTSSAALLRSTVDALDHAADRHHLVRGPRSISLDRTTHIEYLLNGKRICRVDIVICQPPSASSGHPRLAIIIDDIGSDKSAAETLLKLPYPLTFSVLPAQAHSTEIADEAYRRGDQVMLHLPMQFEGNRAKAEPVELRVGMPANEVDKLVGQMLADVPHAIGVNNHEGSLATAQPQLMAELMSDLHQRGLFFIDSRTTAASVAYSAAKSAGVAAASRKVFLDDVETRAAILHQLDLAARDAAENGSAIAIGHPHPATIAALKEDLPRLNSRVQLVFASSLVH